MDEKQRRPEICKRCGCTEWTYQQAGLNIRGAMKLIFFGLGEGILALVLVLGFTRQVGIRVINYIYTIAGELNISIIIASIISHFTIKDLLPLL